MLINHPSTEELASFVRGGPGPNSATRNTKVLRHLLAECGTCRARLATLGWDGSRLERLISLKVDASAEQEVQGSPLFAAANYDAAFAKAERALAALLTEAPRPQTPVIDLLA